MSIDTWIKDIPEGVPTATHEGQDIRSAVIGAAQELGVDPDEVLFTIDLNHIDNVVGRRVPRDTIRVIAWHDTNLVESPVKEAKAWLAELLENMEIEGKIRGTVSGNVITLRVDTKEAGRIVGRQGATIKSIGQLLEARFRDEEDWTIRVDVAKNRQRQRRDDRDERGGDRGRGRGRDRDRDDRRGGGRRDRGNNDIDARERRKLERLASSVSERVLETGEPELIRKELNSFARRIVHLAISDIEGVETESVGDGAYKQIRVVPAEA